MDTSIICDEELGEVICDKCNGKGRMDVESGGYTINRYCNKCDGKGKVDWVENILGVKPKMVDTSSFISFVSQALNSKPHPFQEEIVKQLAEHMAKEIDNEIIRTLHNEAEQNKNKSIRGKSYDNRVFSELMLYTSFKPEV